MNNNPFIILLADDDDTDRMLFTEALEATRILKTVHTLKDGIQLMDYLSGPACLPHVLFLDLNMPRKNGLECLEEIKANPEFNDICIIIYSTSTSAQDMEDAFLKGAHVYIHKPNDFNMLERVLRKSVMIAYNAMGSSNGLPYRRKCSIAECAA